MHSTCSDGELNPRELVEELAKLDIQLFSITDHDSVTSYNYIKKDNLKQNQQIYIPGAEMSVYLDKSHRKHHITVYLPQFAIFKQHQAEFDFPDIKQKIIIQESLPSQQQIEQFDQVNEYLMTLQQKRIIRAQKIINNLNNKYNLHLDWNEFAKRITPESTVGRPMIAQYLREKGYVKTITEAFNSYLEDNNGAVVSTTKIMLSDIIKLFKPLNAKFFVAHPGQWEYGQEKTQQDIYEALDQGCSGFEKYHSDVMNMTYGIENNNVYTIASDFHGMNTLPNCILGCPEGNRLMTSEEKVRLLKTLFGDQLQIINY